MFLKAFAIMGTLLLAGCSGPNTGHMHWHMDESTILATDRYVCDATGETITAVHHSDEGFWVSGGNGEVYGTYETWKQAASHAEQIAKNPPTFGRRWMTCN